jgi:hypothetical protein
MHVEEAQRRLIAKKIRTDFEQFWDTAIESGGSDFIKYVYALLFRVYELHLEDKYMTKMQACRYIPLQHAATCKKYMDIARDKGFFEYVDSESDHRKTIVKPGPQLIDFVEERISSSAAEIDEIRQAGDSKI